MVRNCLLIALSLASVASAQGTIKGTVFAPTGGDVYGTVVIACAPALQDDECDEEMTGFVQISQGGESAPFEIRNLMGDTYLMLVWQDADGDGEITEGDPLNYLMEGSQVMLLTPPVSGLELRFDTAALDAPAAPPAGISSEAELLGTWSRGSVSSVEFYNSTTGSWAPPSGSGSSYTFNPDGTFTVGVMVQSSAYVCTMNLFSYKEGNYRVENNVITLLPAKNKFKSEHSCQMEFNYERDDPLETEYLLWQTGVDEYGRTYLDLTPLVMTPAGGLEVPADAGPQRYTRD